VGHDAFGFIACQVKPVLPDITMLDPVIFLDFFVIMIGDKDAGITTGQALVGIQDRVVILGDIGTEIDRCGQPSGMAFIAGRRPVLPGQN
jgi:hypothetical protein